MATARAIKCRSNYCITRTTFFALDFLLHLFKCAGRKIDKRCTPRKFHRHFDETLSRLWAIELSGISFQSLANFCRYLVDCLLFGLFNLLRCPPTSGRSRMTTKRAENRFIRKQVLPIFCVYFEFRQTLFIWTLFVIVPIFIRKHIHFICRCPI